MNAENSAPNPATENRLEKMKDIDSPIKGNCQGMPNFESFVICFL
jgi:hypothetical protein